MMTDILDDLRDAAECWPRLSDEFGKAAAEITRLRLALDAMTKERDAALETQASVRAKELGDAAKRNELTVRSIKEALDREQSYHASKTAAILADAIRAMIEDKG